MATPGWYPDPSGQPNSFRYWDGRSWSEQTTPDPSVPPPGHAAGSGGSGKKAALIVLAVLLVLALGVGGFVGVRALTDDDDDNQASDESSETTDAPEQTEDTESPDEPESASPTESPSESPGESPSATGGTGEECTGGMPRSAGGEVSRDGSLTGGGLQLPPVEGYTPLPVEGAFTFADGVVTVGKQIEEQWISLYALGSLPKDSGYTAPEQAATQVMECMAGSADFYPGFSGRTDRDSGRIQVDGAPAYSLTSELRVDTPEVSVAGDVARVIVVDVGDPDAFGLYVSVVPIGDQKLVRQQEKATGRLRLSAPAVAS